MTKFKMVQNIDEFRLRADSFLFLYCKNSRLGYLSSIQMRNKSICIGYYIPGEGLRYEKRSNLSYNMAEKIHSFYGRPAL